MMDGLVECEIRKHILCTAQRFASDRSDIVFCFKGYTPVIMAFTMLSE